MAGVGWTPTLADSPSHSCFPGGLPFCVSSSFLGVISPTSNYLSFLFSALEACTSVSCRELAVDKRDVVNSCPSPAPAGSIFLWQFSGLNSNCYNLRSNMLCISEQALSLSDMPVTPFWRLRWSQWGLWSVLSLVYCFDVSWWQCWHHTSSFGTLFIGCLVSLCLRIFLETEKIISFLLVCSAFLFLCIWILCLSWVLQGRPEDFL